MKKWQVRRLDYEPRNPVADFFRTRRADAGLTQEAVAERAMVARSYLGAIESGKMVPSSLKASDIARACEIPFAEFLAFWSAWKKVKLEEMEPASIIKARWEAGERAENRNDGSVQDND